MATIEWQISNFGKTTVFGSGHFILEKFTKREKTARGIKIVIDDKDWKDLMERERKIMLEKVNRITFGNRNMLPAAIRAQIETEERAKNLDFIEFAEKWVEDAKKRIRGWRNYQSAVNSFKEFIKRDTFDVQEMDSKVMFSFEKFLAKSPYNQNKYRKEIAKIYEDMRTEYNNYDRDDIVIPDRLQNWKKTKKKIEIPPTDKGKRTLTADNMRQIANAKFEAFEIESQKVMVEAREVFLLSFCLMAINMRDLWLLSPDCLEDGRLIYNRAKTKVHNEVVVPRQIQAIFDKYRDKKNKYLFDFRQRSDSEEDGGYGQKINRGLKLLAKKLGIKPFTFYATRQTLATISGKELRVSTDTIEKMLSHQDPHKVLRAHYTDVVYDDSNEANEKLMSYLFGNEEIKTFDY